MHIGWKSRKFRAAVGVVVAGITYGLGYKLDPVLIAILIGSEGALWVVIEVIVAAIRKGRR